MQYTVNQAKIQILAERARQVMSDKAKEENLKSCGTMYSLNLSKTVLRQSVLMEGNETLRAVSV